MTRPRNDDEYCALCAKFTTQGHEQQATMGLGYCTGYEVYVRGDSRATVLFKPARTDLAQRRAFLEKHKEKDS
jgi:hypothetical protein